MLTLSAIESKEEDQNLADTRSVNLKASPPCYLLQLPAELRNLIWEYSTIRTESIKFLSMEEGISDEDTETGAPPPLAQTCRQIRSESMDMYYEHNTFRLHTGVLERNDVNDEWFLRALRPLSRNLRHIDIQICDHENFYRLEVEHSSRSLTLEVVFNDDDGDQEGCIVGNESRLIQGRKYLESTLAKDRTVFGLEADELKRLARILAV